MNDKINEASTLEVRINLSKYLNEYKGEVIYITKCHKLVAELIIYTEETLAEAEFEIAKKILQSAKRKMVELQNI